MFCCLLFSFKKINRRQKDKIILGKRNKKGSVFYLETNVLSNEPKTNNSTVDFPDLKKGFTYMGKDSEPKPAILEYNQGITLIIQQKNSITVDNELLNVEKKSENFQETEILEETPKTKRSGKLFKYLVDVRSPEDILVGIAVAESVIRGISIGLSETVVLSTLCGV